MMMPKLITPSDMGTAALVHAITKGQDNEKIHYNAKYDRSFE